MNVTHHQALRMIVMLLQVVMNATLPRLVTTTDMLLLHETTLVNMIDTVSTETTLENTQEALTTIAEMLMNDQHMTIHQETIVIECHQVLLKEVPMNVPMQALMHRQHLLMIDT